MKRYIIIDTLVEAHVKENGEVFYYTKEWKSYRKWTEKLFSTREDAVKCLKKQYGCLRNFNCISNDQGDIVYILVEMNRYIPKTNDLAMHVNYALFEIREVNILENDNLIKMIKKINEENQNDSGKTS